MARSLPTGSVLVLSVLWLLAVTPALAQTDAAGVEAWFYGGGHTDEWRRKAQDCTPKLNRAMNVELEMRRLNQLPKDGDVVRQLNALTTQRTALLADFKDCVNRANRPKGTAPSLRTLGPGKTDVRSAWVDRSTGIFVDANGERWKFDTQYVERGHLFRLDTSKTPVSAIAQIQQPRAEYVGAGGARATRYGTRLSPGR